MSVSLQKPSGRKRGRKTKLTPEICLKIMDALMAGRTRREACEKASIHHSTFYDWYKRDREFRRCVIEGERYGMVKRAKRLWFRHPFRGKRPPHRSKGITKYPKPRFSIRR